jgi:phenylacetate-CoA ligase
MQEVFSAPVYDEYGSCEVGWIACECKKRNGLHIMSDLRHIDIVDDKGHPAPDGEWGRILITDLENRVFPLIRYEIGDRGRLLTRTCSCGITLPLIDKICGRISDAVKLPSGSFISGEFLTTIFDDHPEAVSGFQIRQAADYSISLLCVPGTHPEAKKNIEQAHLRLCERAKNAVQVRLELIDYIPHDRGKTHFIISDVK